MGKKIIFAALLLSGISILIMAYRQPISVEEKKDHAVNWMKVDDAFKACIKQPKPILIDIYTTWCGPCKMMSKFTFENPDIAAYLNKHYYCVKFDAETRDTVRLRMLSPDTIKENGKIKQILKKEKEFVFYNTGLPDQGRTPHQFAASILDNQLSYPSIVFLSPDIMRLHILKGYHTPELFEPYLHYFSGDVYKKTNYADFQKTFRSALPQK